MVGAVSGVELNVETVGSVGIFGSGGTVCTFQTVLIVGIEGLSAVVVAIGPI